MSIPESELSVPRIGMLATVRNRRGVISGVQPFDGPADGDSVQRVLDQIGSDDMLLFASDFPHWHYDGDAMLPAGISEPLRRKILVENALDSLLA